MKRLRIPLVALLALAGVIALLLRNRAVSLQNAARSEMLTAPAVTLGAVASGTTGGALALVGTTVAWNDVTVVSETQGRIVAVHVEPGARVHAGQMLVQVDDELRKAALESAQTAYDKARKDLARYQWLHQEKTVQDAQIENAQLAVKAAEAQFIVAKRQESDTRITAPAAGTVVSRSVDVGTWVQNGTPIANVVDISRLKVRVNVSEQDAFRLRTGDHVACATDVYPGTTFSGTITSISAKGDEAHTYPVEITLPNPAAHPLRAGMFVRVTFDAAPGAAALLIPRTALVGSIRDPQVFVCANDTVRLRSIVVGDATDTALVVRGGLREGERIVTSGQNNLRDGAAVTVVQ